MYCKVYINSKHIILGIGLTARSIFGLFLSVDGKSNYLEGNFGVFNVMQSFGIAFNGIVVLGIIFKGFKDICTPNDNSTKVAKVRFKKAVSIFLNFSNLSEHKFIILF